MKDKIHLIIMVPLVPTDILVQLILDTTTNRKKKDVNRRKVLYSFHDIIVIIPHLMCPFVPCQLFVLIIKYDDNRMMT